MLIAMQIDQIEAFVAIVRHRGFTRAAAALHLSQPAVSRRLELLERALGAPVLERLRGGVALTEGGKAFLPHAEALLASARDGVEAVRALERTDRGAITLALVGTLASTPLTSCLRGFREAYPEVHLRLRTALSQEVSALVRRGDATLGLRYGPDPHPELSASTILEEPMVPVCSPRHRLARARHIEAAALAGEPWVTFPPRPGVTGEPYTTSLHQRLAACGLGEAEIIPIDSLTAQKRMVEAGFGLALLPESSVEEEVRMGTLRPLRAPGMSATIPVVLIRRRRGYLSGAARRLMTLLEAWPAGRVRETARTFKLSHRAPK
jgi:DNA-binding transcriptional LysR family regulator